jgi:hypothetical protein
MSKSSPRRRLAGGIVALTGLGLTMVALVPAVGASDSPSEVGGRLRVEKRVRGEDAPQGPFGFHVRCTHGGEAVLDQNFTIEAGGFAAFRRLPVGAVCVVGETDDGGAASTVVKPADATVVIPDDDSVKVAFVNTFESTTTTSAVATTTSSTSTSTSTTTTTAPATTTTTTAAVLGVTVTRPEPAPAVELPRTGGGSLPLAQAGLVLVVFGLGLRWSSRPRREGTALA